MSGSTVFWILVVLALVYGLYANAKRARRQTPLSLRDLLFRRRR